MLRNLAQDSWDNLVDPPSSVWTPKYSLPTATFDDDRLYRKQENLRYVVFARRLAHGIYGLDDGYESQLMFLFFSGGEFYLLILNCKDIRPFKANTSRSPITLPYLLPTCYGQWN